MDDEVDTEVAQELVHRDASVLKFLVKEKQDGDQLDFYIFLRDRGIG